MRDFTYKHSIIENLARDAKKTPAEYLTDLFSANKKLESAAAEIGVTHACLVLTMKRLGFKRVRAWDFEYCGVMDSMIGHCRRYDVADSYVKYLRKKHGLGKIQALDLAVLNKVWPTA